MYLYSYRLEGRVHRVLCCAPSSLPSHERDIRLLHKYLFLIPARRSDKEYAFWLTQILKPWPITYQARLLYLLTAPEDEDGTYTLYLPCIQIMVNYTYTYYTLMPANTFLS